MSEGLGVEYIQEKRHGRRGSVDDQHMLQRDRIAAVVGGGDADVILALGQAVCRPVHAAAPPIGPNFFKRRVGVDGRPA